ncbi:hypothetical protein [Streptomyces olivochromogenes]|uniref:hypothetical protein n=1 Tax=Streptomyces olivochromogenes TaxID=1963 RepID=UPI0036CF5730
MRLRELLIDAWSWLNCKQAMAHPSGPGHHAFPELNTSWVPAEDLRRLASYKFLAAYDSNQAGQLASVTGGDHHGVERRELGDPAKLIDTTLSYLLGAEQTIVVPGAEHPDQADEEPTPEAKAAVDLQDKPRSWADKELLPLRIQQAERCAVRSGDGLYTLAWEPSKRRVLLRTHDPGWYFPEWDEGEQDAQEYPQRVHFAWELPADPVRGLKDRVRRITYELGPIGPATAPGKTSDGRAIREQVAGADGDPVLTVGDTLDPLTSMVTRIYPWAPGKPSSTTCYLTDAEWLLEDLGSAHDVFSLPANKAAYRVRSDGQVLDRLDLMVDFIPVVHVPNSIPDVGERWGKPTLATVRQLMDELQATDTDSASASSTTGTPIVALAGARLPIDRSTGQPLPVRVEAGTVWQLADNGRMDTLDTSAQLAELRQRVDHRLDRLVSNTRLTTAGLGTLDVAKVPSGYALQLALGPLDSLVGGMRAWPATTSTSCCCAWCSACTTPGRWVTTSVPVGGRCSPCLPARSGTVVARGLLIRSSLAGSVSDGHSPRFTAPKGRYRSGRLLGCGTSLLYTCPGSRLRVRAGGTAEWSPRADTEAGTTSGDHEVSSP